jgi:hypothetical protein
MHHQVKTGDRISGAEIWDIVGMKMARAAVGQG